MTFRKFDHVERGNHRAVDDICRGTVHVFPKLDGTNASVWAEPEFHDDQITGYTVKCGSRNREITPVNDNAGFASYVHGDAAENLRLLALSAPHLIFYGEWLVPHTIKSYVEEAWRKFYIFDVFNRETSSYLSYDIYTKMLDEAGVEYIPAVEMTNPCGPELDVLCAANAFLCRDGEFGEGIVVKNYNWSNAFDRQPWMKVVRDGFMDKKGKPARGLGDDATEEMIAEALVDQHLVDKEFAKGVRRLSENMKVDVEHPGFYDQFVEEHRNKVIGILLAQVFNDVIDDQLTARALKKFGFPTINFRTLRGCVTRRVKLLKPELF